MKADLGGQYDWTLLAQSVARAEAEEASAPPSPPVTGDEVQALADAMMFAWTPEKEAAYWQALMREVSDGSGRGVPPRPLS